MQTIQFLQNSYPNYTICNVTLAIFVFWTLNENNIHKENKQKNITRMKIRHKSNKWYSIGLNKSSQMEERTPN